MRISNQKAIRWLIDNGYDDIHVFSPTKRKDNVYFNKEKASETKLAYAVPTKNDPRIWRYLATDVWNLWDAACFKEGQEYWVQIKTNAWAPETPILDWLKDKRNMAAICINVIHKKRKRDIVKVRHYG